MSGRAATCRTPIFFRADITGEPPGFRRFSSGKAATESLLRSDSAALTALGFSILAICPAVRQSHADSRETRRQNRPGLASAPPMKCRYLDFAQAFAEREAFQRLAASFVVYRSMLRTLSSDGGFSSTVSGVNQRLIVGSTTPSMPFSRAVSMRYRIFVTVVLRHTVSQHAADRQSDPVLSMPK